MTDLWNDWLFDLNLKPSYLDSNAVHSEESLVPGVCRIHLSNVNIMVMDPNKMAMTMCLL